jgi:hypothetical protein
MVVSPLPRAMDIRFFGCGEGMRMFDKFAVLRTVWRTVHVGQAVKGSGPPLRGTGERRPAYRVERADDEGASSDGNPGIPVR